MKLQTIKICARFLAACLLAAFLTAAPTEASVLPKYKITEEMEVPHEKIERHAMRVVVGQGLSKEQVESLIWYIAMTEQLKHNYEMLTIWMHHDQDENMGTYSVAMLNYGRLVPEPHVAFNAYYFEPFDETLIVKRLPLEKRKEIYRYGGKMQERLTKFGITEQEDIHISVEGYSKNWKNPGN
ncbi:hypothetical protein LJC40_04685 [Synergistaceae bacterium OttesenSCG-928-D05]|nr:hypothetical protein [Synergistaceae bacterium OttesenSCG-928-D05]